jgi:hypothetical protein
VIWSGQVGGTSCGELEDIFFLIFWSIRNVKKKGDIGAHGSSTVDDEQDG